MASLRVPFAALLCLPFVVAAPRTLPAAPPTAPEVKAKLIGQPTALLVQPESLALHGPRGGRQLLITGRYADGSLRDLTALAEWKVENEAIAAIDEDRFVLPRGE